MEFKIAKFTLPEQILFNYEELKFELTEKCKEYENLVYTDNEIKQAKVDKASLNKLKKALNDERIKREKEYMQPFNDFKNRVNEIIAIIDKPVAIIDVQIKEYENKVKSEKAEKVKGIFESLNEFDWLEINQIANPKWANASCSLKSIEEEIEGILLNIKSNLDVLSRVEHSFEAVEFYKKSLDMQTAIIKSEELAEIDRKKAEQQEKEEKRLAEEKRKAEEIELDNQQKLIDEGIPEQMEINDFISQPSEVARQWVNFSAHLSVYEAEMLKEFFERTHIEFKAI